MVRNDSSLNSESHKSFCSLNFCSKTAWHGGSGPHCVKVAESDVREALPCTPLIEGPAEAEHQPSDSRQAHGNDAHHHCVHDVVVTDQPPIKEGKPGRHEENQRAGHGHPRGVTIVEALHLPWPLLRASKNTLGGLSKAFKGSQI